MKILQINKFYYLKGGAERYMFELTQALEDAGHEVIPFSMKSKRNKQSRFSEYFFDEVNLDSFSIRNIIKIFYNYDAIRKLKKLIKEEKPQVAHLHNIYYQVSPAIIKLLKKNNIRVVMTLHDYFLVCPNYNLYTGGKICLSCVKGSLWNVVRKKCIKNSYLKSLLAWCEFKYNHNLKRYYDMVDVFIAPSQYMKDICIQYGIDESKIKVLNNFTDPVESSQFIKKEDYILYFGRVSREKGVDLLLRAYNDSTKRYKLHIVGEGEQQEELEDYIRKNGIKERVKMLGYKEKEELEKEIQKAQAIIIPSVWPENMPYVLLESMARGKAVIASRIGGMSEIIEDGYNGYLFTMGNQRELSQKIESLFDQDLDKIEKNAKNSINTINSKYHINKLINIYKY